MLNLYSQRKKTAAPGLVIRNTRQDLNHGCMERNFANFRRTATVADEGKPMARNFGVPMRSARYQPGAFWSLLPLAFIAVGLISAVAHLRQPFRCESEHPAIPQQAWRMIKRVLFAVLVFAAPVWPVSAQDAKVSVDMIGIGGMSCAHWRSTKEHLLEGTVWIYGFWTGLNYVSE